MCLVLKYVFILLWLIYTFASIILLFSKGLLLHRDVLPNKSICETDVDSLQELTQNCTKTNTKVVMIIIDALRHDFVIHSEQDMPYTNKITVFRDILASYPKQSRLYKFIADPPTTTMQRLTALTTGSLPTFIDVGSNFATEELLEDNVIDQLVNNRKKVVFMGDDTWANLFPKRFYRNYTYPSFNVWDLDTVDEGIKKNLYPEIVKDDWDVLIAHFLGVDHCGHRYGPNHKEMERKLNETNVILRDILKEILGRENIMLFVFGDHGMTSNGDHGGESENELTSALFVLSSSQELQPKTENDIKQVDLVPTISTIMGVPIPFSNIGSLIKSALPQNFHLVNSIWRNAKQINDYLTTYSLKNDELNDKHIHFIKDSFKMLDIQHNTFVKSCENFMQLSRRACEEVWIRFDESSIYKGLVLMFVSLYFSFLLVGSSALDNYDKITGTQVLIMFSIVVPLNLIAFLFYFYKIIHITVVFFITGFIGTIFLALFCVACWSSLTQDFLNTNKPDKILIRIFTVLTTLGFFSNSYIIEESYVLHTSFVLLLWYLVVRFKLENRKTWFRNKIKPKNFSLKHWITSLNCKVVWCSILLCIILRYSHSFWKCREEQGWCFEDGAQTKTGNSIISLIVIVIAVTLVHKSLKCSGNLTGCSLNVYLSSFLPKIFSVLISVHWIFESSFQHVKPTVPYIAYIPNVIILLTVLLIMTLFASPLLVHYVDLQEGKANQSENFYELIYRIAKNIVKMQLGPHIQGYPIVYGLATVYSATFLIFSILLCIFGGLLFGYVYAVSVVIMIISIWIMAMIVSVIRHNQCTKINELYTVNWLYILLWTLSSSYWFYGTGHNPSFPAIHWNAAFVLQSDIKNNTWLPGFFILANTFFSHAVHAFLLPLLLICPFTIHGAWSGKSLPPKDEDEQTMARGELLLAEKSRQMIHGAFDLTAKYILVNCFRVAMVMAAATIHSRHLMMWKIFAPKLIFEGIALFITLPFSFFGFILMYRVTQHINVLFERIMSQHSN
ncbi:GPI ethanolamine phosphate transferase 3 [Aphis gossypii]|uniref:GPI ethanolamine phosphate transferase 3 n=1 Tax=Aphis gossypii TaxID=80765 RepID=UPI0021594D1B|nr:GPI ethanolamine phosphate transferase 3 [Aphis gossypii]